MQKNTCCFSGHRKLPKDKIDSITKRLHAEIDNLIHNGVTGFVSGGARGFDLLAASMIVAKKGMGQKIKLIFMLPWHRLHRRDARRHRRGAAFLVRTKAARFCRSVQLAFRRSYFHIDVTSLRFYKNSVKAQVN